MRTNEIRDTYMLNTLRSLPKEKKIEIIAFLSNSMLEDNAVPLKPDLYTCFKGEWGGDTPTDEYCEMLRTEGLAPAKDVPTW